jgi:hypothetical protein
MERVKDIIRNGVKNLALSVTFGAYHAYIIDLEHKNQREIIDLENKLMLEEVRKTIAEEKQKRWW